MNWELPDVPAGFRKGRGTRDQIADPCWLIEKARKFQKNIYLCFIDYAEAFVWIKTNWKTLFFCCFFFVCLFLFLFWKFLKRWEYQTTLPVFWETCMQVKKQQLALDMKQWTGSKLGKEYHEGIYCHPTYLTYMQSTSCKMPGWMNNKL